MSDERFEHWEQQRKDWEKFAGAEEARGVCPHSGLTFGACKAAICDCFDYPPAVVLPSEG